MERSFTAHLLHIFCKAVLRPAKLGRGSFIAPPYRISNPKALSIGENSRIGQYAFFVLCNRHNRHSYDPQFSIGDNVRIGNDLFVGCQKQVTINNNVLISSRVFIADTTHAYQDVATPVVQQDLTEGLPVVIHEDAFVGVNACILPGVSIGKHAVVAAGAIVTRSVAPYTVVAGNPAVPIKRCSFENGTWLKVDRNLR